MRRAFPLVTAHSGCMGSPPNGAEHIALAIASGADLVELDIRMAPDGRVVLAHDEDAALEEGILDLDRAFDLLEGEGSPVVNLDAKEPEAALAAALIARARGLEDSVLFSGLGPAETALMRERIPRFRYLLNADSILPASGYGGYEIRAACRMAAEHGCCGLNLEWSSASRELMDYARLRCLPVLLWTVDAEDEMLEALELGPYSLTTNRPDLLMRLLGKDQGR
ncbi:MAG TPA: glycerophosphodiester phosphodiesterase [Rectinemataceae bacterium]|nr:glycerophosphodiester phosphodiesterase [Rectinemataceae bacterium]